MKFYSLDVRPAGDVLNSVPRVGVSAAEVIALRHVHGQDGVANVIEIGEQKINPRKERKRLDEKFGEQKMLALFGVPGSMRLPEEFIVEDVTDDDEDEDDVAEGPFIPAQARAAMPPDLPDEDEGELPGMHDPEPAPVARAFAKV
jgi:hypothetical protein